MNATTVADTLLNNDHHLQAEMAILDEIDSGLDIDALRDVATAVNGLKTPERSVLMVTHYRVRTHGGMEWRGEEETCTQCTGAEIGAEEHSKTVCSI